MTSPTSTSGQAEALEVLAWFTNSKVGGPRLRGTGDVSNNPEYVSLYSEWRWEPLVRLADADARIAAAESRAAAAEEERRELLALLSRVRGEIVHRPTCAIDYVPRIDAALNKGA